MRRGISFLLPVLAAAACSSQKTPDYAGDPLAQVHGTITSSAPAASEVIVAVGWAGGDNGVKVDVGVRGDFPARFSLDILSPPPPDFRITLNQSETAAEAADEVRFSVGTIFAYPPGVQDPLSKNTPTLGVVEDFMVAYVERDAQPGSRAATFLGGPLRAGFHLMKVSKHPYDRAAWEACNASLPGAPFRERYAKCHALDVFDKLTESEQGFAADVTLRLAPKDELDIPNCF